MVCFHNRYTLGDEDTGYDKSDFDSWEELKKQLIKDGAVIVLPLYLYDHSGITMNTTGFSCSWDSGQVGFIFITREKIKEEYGVTRIDKKLKERITKYLIGEVETYDQYLTGDVYGYKAFNKETNEEVDSCWGYYGDDFENNGLLSEYKGAVEVN